jgi:hypothetical protein
MFEFHLLFPPTNNAFFWSSEVKSFQKVTTVSCKKTYGSCWYLILSYLLLDSSLCYGDKNQKLIFTVFSQIIIKKHYSISEISS